MIHNIHNWAETTITMPLTQAAKKMAQKFADQQISLLKKEQVYLNTLAVCAVNDYLQMVGFPTELVAGDSWNPAMRLISDVADLKVTGCGNLECRPIKTGENICHVPPEFWEERIGYAIVQIDDEHQQATILGYSKTANNGELEIDKLQPIDELLEHLENLAQTANKPQVNLSQWFQNKFEAGWQSFQSLRSTAPNDFAFAYHHSVPDREREIEGIKLLDLGMQLQDRSLVLLVGIIEPASKPKVSISVQLHITGRETHFPPNLKLLLVSESGAILQKVEARIQDNSIRLKEFKYPRGKKFSIQVMLDDVVKVTETFLI